MRKPIIFILTLKSLYRKSLKKTKNLFLINICTLIYSSLHYCKGNININSKKNAIIMKFDPPEKTHNSYFNVTKSV